MALIDRAASPWEFQAAERGLLRWPVLLGRHVCTYGNLRKARSKYQAAQDQSSHECRAPGARSGLDDGGQGRGNVGGQNRRNGGRKVSREKAVVVIVMVTFIRNSYI